MNLYICHSFYRSLFYYYCVSNDFIESWQIAVMNDTYFTAFDVESDTR